MTRLRVGVNLLWLVPGVVGGSEEYSVRLLRAVAEHRPDDLDLVLFVHPGIPAAHAEVARAAIAAGKHVYGEKPLAVTTGQAREVLAAAARAPRAAARAAGMVARKARRFR